MCEGGGLRQAVTWQCTAPWWNCLDLRGLAWKTTHLGTQRGQQSDTKGQGFCWTDPCRSNREQDSALQVQREESRHATKSCTHAERGGNVSAALLQYVSIVVTLTMKLDCHGGTQQPQTVPCCHRCLQVHQSRRMPWCCRQLTRALWVHQSAQMLLSWNER